MLKAVVDPEKCSLSKQCNKCIAGKSCTKKAIFKIDPEDTALVETTYCNACGTCLPNCPTKAITIKEM